MVKYTTPALPLIVEDIDLSTNEDVRVTFEQGTHKFTKSGEDLHITTETHGQQTDTTITVVLTQAETGSFDDRSAIQIQVNYINASGRRDATNIAKIEAGRNLLAEVIEYGN